MACAVLIPSLMNAEKHHKHHGKENEKPLIVEWERKAVHASSSSAHFAYHKPSRKYHRSHPGHRGMERKSTLDDADGPGFNGRRHYPNHAGTGVKGENFKLHSIPYAKSLLVLTDAKPVPVIVPATSSAKTDASAKIVPVSRVTKPIPEAASVPLQPETPSIAANTSTFIDVPKILVNNTDREVAGP